MEYGAAYIGYVSFSSNYNYTNEGMQAYYTNGSPVDSYDGIGIGHAVTIVGWDDSFSREHFCEEMRPENDGAWLCKNSWGTENGSYAEGYEGYFWMSYESKNDGDIAQYVMQSVEEFDNIYQHQYSTNNAIGVTAAANVFTAKNDEILEQICFSNYLPADLTVEIYKLNENYTAPEDGELLTSFEESVDYSGTHSLDVPQNVELNAGDTFSVVLKSDNEFYLLQKFEGSTKLENVSFFMTDDLWQDVTDIVYPGYMSIKAYTSNKNDDVNKAELSALIADAENLEISEYTSQEIKDNLSAEIQNAQKVLNDSTATQNTVDNMCCLIGRAIDDCRNSYYEINSLEDFLNLNIQSKDRKYSEAHIILNTDLDFIDCNEISPLFETGKFSGVFDGNGHTISNLRISIDVNCGLFKELNGATVKNLKLDNCSFSSNQNTGSIAGTANNSTITDCTVSGTKVINEMDYAGGILGSAKETTYVTNCVVSDSEIASKNGQAGGIAGLIYTLIVEDCSISETEIIALDAITLFAVEYTNCEYEDIVLKTTSRIRLEADKVVYNISFAPNCCSMIVYEDDKFTLQPYIGTITDASSDEAIVTKVGDVYEIDLDEQGFVLVDADYEPLDTNGFTFSFDILSDEITLLGYYNSEDVNATEVVFPSYIGGLPVTDMDYDFSMESAAPVKAIVLPDNLNVIYDYMFNFYTDLESVTIPVSITDIQYGAFNNCFSITDVYYGGTEEQWNKISIGERNYYLINANIHFAEEETTSVSTDPVESTSVTVPESTTTEPAESTTVTEPSSTVTEPVESTTATEPESTVTEPVESTTETEPESTVTEPVESTTETEPESTVTEPVESTTATEPSSTVTEPVESTTATESSSTVTEPIESTTATEATEPTQETTTAPQPEFESGDVNRDGKFNIKDATAIQKYLAKMIDFDTAQLALADCNKDNKVNIKDVTYIQKKIAKLI